MAEPKNTQVGSQSSLLETWLLGEIGIRLQSRNRLDILAKIEIGENIEILEAGNSHMIFCIDYALDKGIHPITYGTFAAGWDFCSIVAPTSVSFFLPHTACKLGWNFLTIRR
jgi:hypothetical protein